MIRWPLQALVTVNERGDFETIYTLVIDPLIASFLKLCTRLAHPPAISRLLRAYSDCPFAPNLSCAEYIPTRLRTLRTHFPRHRLLLSDFSSLPHANSQRLRPSRTDVLPKHHRTRDIAPGFFDSSYPRISGG
ncbi:hypothetical protein B0H16DRAFT_1018544 [Mycena metata]|uniref:Protein arginine methyltransferase NDUFAF7 n=1 Tax=Mycena metata TaxID=1033252 RepID=A0AAD7IGY7_9AGAR|nr:hypothetical protein B0H16DRAFT_1018544 [Mycena metata]